MTEYLKDKDPAKCYGCRACEHICPRKAISMKPDEEGFLYPVLDKLSCTKCTLCSQVCPVSVTAKSLNQPLKVYAAQNRHGPTLVNSSSGGIFSAVADYVLEKNGAVAGCIFDKNFTAVHIVSEERNMIAKMRGSKYIQSDTKNTFEEIKQRLKSNQLVLFTGTPCQVDGLKRYLRKDYENLITVDLICHGVPSPLLFSNYMETIKKQRGQVVDFKFRNKELNGWCAQGSITYLNHNKKKTDRISPNNDSYYYYYLQNNVNRISCYSCKYASVQRVSDITIGDYWGVNDTLPSVSSKGGISVILVNNERGQNLIEAINDKLILYETGLSSAVKGNGNLIKPTDMPASRNEIFKRIETQGYAAVAKEDCRYQYAIPFLRKHTPRWVKGILKKFAIQK